MDDIREHLLRRAYLYGDAEAYAAGVEAALAAVTTAGDVQSDDRAAEPVLASAAR
ncbi:hypothetical protein [Euzebya sp.]|uniref:hypothetical protein n=1 Tax=Euzebya sp. TaxID=1971409 RepID=UPI0035182A65